MEGSVAPFYFIAKSLWNIKQEHFKVAHGRKIAQYNKLL